MSELNGGYVGKILRVNLSTQKTATEELKRVDAIDYLGGKGLSAYILFKELKRNVNPLGRENKLVFMTGPLTGTSAPCACRFSVATKSPLTGIWLDSHCGGFWGPELKFAGFDGIIVEGASREPVYLHVEDGFADINPAKDLWGKSTFETIETLQKRHRGDRTVRVASIGVCGERLGLTANIIADVRAAGRGGSGAVMGSKKLKAISVVSHGTLDIEEKEQFEDACQTALRKIRENQVTSLSLTYYGTANIALTVNEVGGWPTRNFQQNSFELAEEVSGEAFSEHLWGGGRAWKPCFGCTIRCGHVAKIKTGKFAGLIDEGPEYETIWAFGPQCGIADREVITAADYFSDYYGIDTISLGNTIGFLMECYERGLIGDEETDGVKMTFGNAEALLATVHSAGKVEGNLGKLASSGVRCAAERVGSGSESFAMHVKGLEIPAYDPRSAEGMALAYILSDRGACHLRPWTYGVEQLGSKPRVDPFILADKPFLIKSNAEAFAVIDSVGLCLFTTFAISVEEDIFNLVRFATGLEYTREEFMRTGERILNLTRAFNVREGIDSKDDRLPWRVVNEPALYGSCKGRVAQAEKILPRFYRIAGWDENGKPKKDKLMELNLDYVIKEIYG